MLLDRPFPVTKPDVLCWWNCWVMASLCCVMMGCVVVNRSCEKNKKKNLFFAIEKNVRFHETHFACSRVSRESAKKRRQRDEIHPSHNNQSNWICVFAVVMKRAWLCPPGEVSKIRIFYDSVEHIKMMMIANNIWIIIRRPKAQSFRNRKKSSSI